MSENHDIDKGLFKKEYKVHKILENKLFFDSFSYVILCFYYQAMRKTGVRYSLTYSCKIKISLSNLSIFSLQESIRKTCIKGISI